MTRTRIGAALAVLALALLAVPGGSNGDSSNPTWAGVWDSDFGRMTLGAGGSGTYEGFTTGTISGHVAGAVDEGTWQQGDKKGDFKFTLSGLSFTGEWHYDTGGCGSACGWSGTCVDGACLKNDDPPPSEPPACPARGANAFAAAKEVAKCAPLQYGPEFSVKAPRESSAVNISPKPVPATAREVFLALRDLLFAEEANKIVAAIELSLEKDPSLGAAFEGCLTLTTDVGRDDEGEYLIVNDTGLALFKACHQLVTKGTARPRAGSAAAGCEAAFVPAFTKGEKVTKRKRRRAVRAARSSLDASCRNRDGSLKASIRARKGKKLRAVTGRRLRATVSRRLAPGATYDPDQRLGVRWRARKR